MIHQCYFEDAQRQRLFDSPLYRGFGLYTAVNPDIARRCPELEDPKNQPLLSEYAAMLHLWRNLELDPDPWIGFTSYRQLEKFPTVLGDRGEVERLLGEYDFIGWGCYQFMDARTNMPISMAEQGERAHPGVTLCLWRLLMMRGEPMPRNYLTTATGMFCNYWAMSKENFDAFMRWSYPLVNYCLRCPDEFVRSHPRSLSYLVERLFVCWYELHQKRCANVGIVQVVPCGNLYYNPAALEGTEPAARESFLALPAWNTSLLEICYRHRAAPKGVIHVGAHWAEEREIYRHLCGSNVIWVEADPDNLPQLRANLRAFPEARVIEACLADEDGRETQFYRTNNRGESSSILPMGIHRQMFTSIHVTEQTVLRTTTFATLARREQIDLARYDFLVMDVQGAELLALKGFGDLLGQFTGVYLEVNLGELYKGCALLPEIDAYLGRFGFERREAFITQQQYGDAFYLRRGTCPAPPADLPQRARRAAVEIAGTRSFTYRAAGQEPRVMELMEGGGIALGSAPEEQMWLLRAFGHDVVLNFAGQYGRAATLVQGPDSVWRGVSLLRPDAPVELIPRNAAPRQRRPMGYPHATNMPVDLVEKLRDLAGARAFVETGTRHGVTTKVAASRFRKVYTIEIEPVSYRRSAAELAPLKNVRCILGDSAAEVPGILRELDGPAVFWLDAHWSAGDTGKGSVECPVLEELGAIYAHRPDHVVLIDDARYFLCPPPPPHDSREWPAFTTLNEFLQRQRPAPVVQVVGDVIVAVPAALGEAVDSYRRAFEGAAA
jgi:FkbM family methyltransferase